ncbi:MAG TPA: aldehyde dehydrogenase family protein, partial [Marmoricola sp.]|nr:aldehyde dehydrogenase family protein [Marmoricola sp.]
MSELIQGVRKSLYINGEWVDAEGGKTLEVSNPADGSVLCSVADGSPADGKRALDAAAAAQREWARTEPRVRSEMLRKAFELLIERADDFAMLMTLEMGK